MRKTTRILFVVLAINAVVMVAGLLLGPNTAGSAFFMIGIGLGAYAAHRRGREKDMKTEVMKPLATTSWNNHLEAMQETSRRSPPLPGKS